MYNWIAKLQKIIDSRVIIIFFCTFCAFSLAECKLFYNFAKFQKKNRTITEILNNTYIILILNNLTDESKKSLPVW